jgi:hypothetical protein
MNDEARRSRISLDAEAIAESTRSLAQTYQGNSLQLLKLLRLLESLHREIREDLFQAALPNNRQALYHLLRDIEREGGWPYIPVVKLRELIAQVDGDLLGEK